MLSAEANGRASSSSVAVRSEPSRRPPIDQAQSIDYQVTPSFVAPLDRLGCSLVITNCQSSTMMTSSGLGDGGPRQPITDA
jgi:hypothetical protein